MGGKYFGAAKIGVVLSFISYRKLLWSFLLLTLLISVQKILQNDFNNFRIFASSFAHLLKGIDLYGLFPEEHFDHFKYTPTFALLMGPWAVLPLSFGGVLWNFLSALLLGWGITRLSLSDELKRNLMLIALPEYIGSLQNFQSNVLLVGLFLACFHFLERKRWFYAALALGLAGHIKIFALALTALGFCYSKPLRFVGYLVVVLVVLTLAPAVWVGWEGLLDQYQNFYGLQSGDVKFLEQDFYSLMHLIEGLFQISGVNLIVQAVGALVTLGLFLGIRASGWGYPDRCRAVALLLIWMVFFNHRAESPTFVIAMVGFGLWYVNQPPSRSMSWVLWLTLLLVSFLYSDLTTPSFKREWLKVYHVKAWPWLVIWPWIYGQLVLARVKLNRISS